MFGRSFGVFAAAAILGLSVLAYSDGTGSSVIYVNASATGANTGESWDNAFTSLQSALDAAISGCEIWVAEGTYKPSKEVDGTGARYRTFQLQNEVGLYGGFKGNEISRDLRNWEVNKTILSGDLNGNGKDNNDAYHVFYRLPKPGDEYINTSAVLDGFVISGGNANGAGFHGCGGGMYNSASGPTISNCTFVNNSAIFMGGAICNENASHSTIINCIFRNNTAENGGGILNSSSGIVVTDCTFANNSATKNGGGIDSRIPQQDIPFANWEPTITNCFFADNAAQCGGGMCNWGGVGVNGTFAQATITQCTFQNNSANLCGGGLYNLGASPLISQCVLTNNEAPTGGGIYNEMGSSASSSAIPVILECTFNSNTATSGGAIYSLISFSINQCIFRANSSKDYGGAVYNKGYTSTIHGCMFIENTSTAGGGVWNSSSCPIITNSIFSGNSAATGGGLGSTNLSDAMVDNCTFYNNSAKQLGGGLYNTSTLTAANCILWGNTAPEGTQVYGTVGHTPIITYSNIQGGWAGAGNINSDPLFENAAGEDFALQAGSPCIDKGFNAKIPAGILCDFIGTKRIVDGNYDWMPIVDMGAHEYYLPGDLNFTCSVDMSDLCILSGYWMQAGCVGPGNCGQADIDRNHMVDIDDFMLLVEHWMKSESITPPPPPLPFPMTWWKMNEAAGTAVSDSAGGYHGQTVNITGTPWVIGPHDYALKLDGVDDYVDVGGYAGVMGTSSRTCMAWIKANSTGKEQVILSWGNGANGQKWMFRVQSDGKLAVAVWGGYISGSVSVADGQWHHVAAVLFDDGSPSVNEIRLYVDGFPQTVTSSSSQAINTVASQNVQMGSVYNGTAQGSFFSGLLDEVRIYDVPLTGEQILRVAME